MKAKRFLSFVVSLSLAVSLAAPAMAQEGTEDGFLDRYAFIDQYIANTPAAEDFDDEAWYQEYVAWDVDDMTKEEYMEWLELSEEEFRAEMWQSYAWEMGLPIYEEAEAAYDAYVVEYYEAAHPGELEGLSTEDLLARMGYTETLTPVEQFIKDWGLDGEDEVRPALLRAYALERLNAEKLHADFLAYQGEYPEKWAEFDADAYFGEQYAYGFDSKEEYMETMELSEEVFVEIMFVEYVEYNRWEWEHEGEDNWYWDGQDYERLITLYVNGQPVDTDVTAADGVTYADPAVLGDILGTKFPGSDPISIRSAAEAAGWDVTWNSYRRQVVLMDREKLLTGVIVPGLGWVEEDISGLDRLAEKAQTVGTPEPGQSYQTTGTVDIAYTSLNSLDGDETYTARLKVETLVRDKVCEASFAMNLADLLRLVPAAALEEMKAELPKSARDLGTLLKSLRVDLIWNGETGALYVNAPFVALVDPTPGVSGNAWYAFDLSELLEAETAAASVPEALYRGLLEDSETGWSGAEDAYSDFVAQKGLFYILFGPHAVTEKNGTLTWELDGEMISGALSAFMGTIGKPDGWDDCSLFKECRLKLTVDPKGNTGFDMALRPDVEGITDAVYESDPYYSLMSGLVAARLMGMADFRVTAGGRTSAQGGSAELELHWKNSFKLTLDMETARKEVRTAPRTAPPDGAEIVEV